MKLRSWVEIEVPAHLHQLVYPLRHRNIEDLDHGHHVGDVLHGAQLDLFLCSLRLGQAGRPYPLVGVLLVEQLEERLGRRGLLSPWRVVLVLVPVLPGPGHDRSLCAVVQLLGQGHRDGHPLMSQP